MFRKFGLWLAGLGKGILAFIVPIVARQGEKLLTEALPIALEIVKSYESSGADGALKRERAVGRLRAELINRGHATVDQLSTSALNWVVETALQRLRAGKL